MSIIRQSTLLSFCFFLTLLGGSANKGFVNQATASSEANQSISIENVQQKNDSPHLSDGTKVTQNRVKVFFPNPARNRNDLGYVQPVWRTTQRSDLAKFAVEQLIVGPTRNESRMGLIKPIQFRGNSNCGGNFTLSISSGVARLKFCKTVPSAGIGDDARVTSSINATLKQFRSVKSVIILTKEGDCLGDMSGENRCLRR